MIFNTTIVEAKILDEQEKMKIVEAIWQSNYPVKSPGPLTVRNAFTDQTYYGAATKVKTVNIIEDDLDHDFEYAAHSIEDEINRVIEGMS